MRKVFLLMALYSIFALPSAFAQEDVLRTALDAENWVEVVAQAELRLAKNPQDLDAMNAMAIAWARQGDKARSVALMHEMKAISPENAKILNNLCAMESELALPTAVDSCLEAVKKTTDNPDLYYLVGQTLERAKRPDEAREMYEKAWSFDLKNLVYATAVMAIDFAKNDDAKALEVCEKSMAAGGTDTVLYLNAIVAARGAKKYEKAVEYADKGYERYHDNAMIAGKMEALEALGRYEEVVSTAAKIDFESDLNDVTYGGARLSYVKSLLALSCSTDTHQTCASATPDACCARERLVLSLAQKTFKSRAARERDGYVGVYLAMAQILNNQLEDAEKTLTPIVQKMDAKRAWGLAVLAADLNAFSDARDRETAQKYLEKALSFYQGNLEALMAGHPWPPRIAESLREMNRKATNPSGCGCEMMNTPSDKLPNGWTIIALIPMILLLVLRRKKA